MTTTINASTTSGLVQTADTSGVLQFQTNGTTAVTVDASQNVGIGTTSPTSKITIGGSGDQYITRSVTNGSIIMAGGIGVSGGATDGGFIARGGTSSYNVSGIEIYTNGSERMRIDSSGNVLVNTTTGDAKFRVDANLNAITGVRLVDSGTTTGNYIIFTNSAGNNAGTINHNGTTTVAYNTSSDYRLKENIIPMAGALDKVMQLNPVTYTWKNTDNELGEGFIAHELAEVCPIAVTGTKDAVDEEGKPVYQGVDTSFLVATLTKAIQEQQELIKQLQADVASLKEKA